MKQFLSKALDVLRWAFRIIAQFTIWVVALLRSVNIDQPRGVMLCLALQLVTIIAFLVAFRRDTESPSRPVPGQSIPASTNDDAVDPSL